MQTVISKDGTTIAFDRVGTGPALILVGGALSTRGAGAEQAKLLAPHFTVYTFDRRGRGDSGDTAPYAVKREIEDLAAMIEEAGGSAFVLGHSSGAVLALEAAKAGLPITKLALYEPPFIIDDSRPPVPTDYVDHLQRLTDAGKREEAVEYFMTVAVGIPPAYMEQLRKAPTWASSVATAHTLSYDGRIVGDTMFGDPATLQRFAAIQTPTLVMDGGKSEPFMHNGAETITKVLPHAHHRRLAGQDHGAAPDVLAPVLIEFFNR